MGLLFKNNAETTLSSGINNSVTTVPVTSAAVFPTPTNDVFFATIDDGSNIEVVKVTGISSNDLTVVRAQDNTSAATFGSGAKIELRLTAKVLDMGTASLIDLDGDTKIQVEKSADEDHIRFDTGGSERMVINNSGNVGIGTSSPSKKFHVKGDEILVEDPSGGYSLGLNADTNPVTITANDKTGANYAGFKLRTLNGGSSPVTAMDVYPNGGASVGFGTTARTDTQMVISKRPTSATQTTPETILTLSTPCVTTASDIKVGQGPRIVFEIPDDQTGNKATGAAIAALKEIDSDTNSQTTLAFYTSDDDETLDQNMTILSDGKVGIGTTSPTEKLTVNGNIANTSGDFTLDVAGDIILDAGAENIKFHDDGTEIGQIDLGSANMNIRSSVQDKNIIFVGNDSGTEIEAMRIDYADAGKVLVKSNEIEFDNSTNNTQVATIAINDPGNLSGKYLRLKGHSGVRLEGNQIEFYDNASTPNLYLIVTEGPSSVNPTFSATGAASDTSMFFRTKLGGSTYTSLSVDANGITAYGNVTAYSDERLKDNIKTIENGLDKVEQLRGVTYTRDGKESIGVIAQEVEKIFPEIVLTADDEMGTKSVDYGKLTSVLIEAVKELSAKVKELEGK